jgi:hypothetical protein
MSDTPLSGHAVSDVLSEIDWRRNFGLGPCPCGECGDKIPGITPRWPWNRGPLPVLAGLYGHRLTQYDGWHPDWVDHTYVQHTAEGSIYISEPYCKRVGNHLVGASNHFSRDIKHLRSLGWRVTASTMRARHVTPDGTIALMLYPPVETDEPPTFRQFLFAQIEAATPTGDLARDTAADLRDGYEWDGEPASLRARIIELGGVAGAPAAFNKSGRQWFALQQAQALDRAEKKRREETKS